MNNEAPMMSYWDCNITPTGRARSRHEFVITGYFKSFKLNKKSLDKSQLARRKGSSSLIDESYRAFLLYYVICRIRTEYGYVPLLPLSLAHFGIDRKNKIK